MTNDQFEALKKRAVKVEQRHGFEVRAVITELVEELSLARKPKPKAKAKKIAS
jgi:hypothetical protein